MADNFDLLQVGQFLPNDGSVIRNRGGRGAELMVSELMAPYYEQVRNGNVFGAHAIVTAPVIYTTAAGTGGPLIWNGSTNKNLVLLAAGFGSSVVTTVAGSLGITGNTAQTVAPTATTPIDSRWNCLLGGAASVATPYKIGTPVAAGNFFMPIGQFHTGALTVDNTGVAWVDLKGIIVVPPGGWVSLAGSATLSTLVMQSTLLWMEVPI